MYSQPETFAKQRRLTNYFCNPIFRLQKIDWNIHMSETTSRTEIYWMWIEHTLISSTASRWHSYFSPKESEVQVFGTSFTSLQVWWGESRIGELPKNNHPTTHGVSQTGGTTKSSNSYWKNSGDNWAPFSSRRNVQPAGWRARIYFLAYWPGTESRFFAGWRTGEQRRNLATKTQHNPAKKRRTMRVWKQGPPSWVRCWPGFMVPPPWVQAFVAGLMTPIVQILVPPDSTGFQCSKDFQVPGCSQIAGWHEFPGL